MKKKLGCFNCGTLSSDPFFNKRGQALYWMAANKGTTDFLILMSNMKETLLGSRTPAFPQTHHDKFDYYCSKCFVKLSERTEKLVNDE